MKVKDIQTGHFYQRGDGPGLRVKVAQVRDTDGPTEAKVFFSVMSATQPDLERTELHTMAASRFADLYRPEIATDPERDAGPDEKEQWGPGDLWAMQSLAELDPCDQHALTRIAIQMYSHYGDPHSVLSDTDVQTILRSRELFVDEGIW